MDDGGKLDYTDNQGKGIVYNTQGFKEQEVKLACEELNSRACKARAAPEKFDLNCWMGLNSRACFARAAPEKTSDKNFR